MVGNTINLHLKTPDNEATTDAKIIKVFEPFTLSSVMVVQIACSDLGLEGDMVLKLFDRRFATQLRSDEKCRPWDSDIEKDYQKFVLNGCASKFITEINNGGEIGQQGETWNASQDEAYLHDHLLDLYNTEVQVYDTVKDLQGKDIPKLLACALAPGSSSAVLEPVSRGFPGLLIEYIPGIPLTDIADHIPRESWQGICEDAIRILNLMGDRGILNEDVKTRSFIVNLEEGSRTKMIDFALCKFREDYEDDDDWQGWKAIQDEEGAIGRVMQDRLDGGFVYHRSDRWKRPASLFE